MTMDNYQTSPEESDLNKQQSGGGRRPSPCCGSLSGVVALAALYELGNAHARTCSVIESLPLLCRRSRRRLIQELVDLTCAISGHHEDAAQSGHNEQSPSVDATE